MDILLHLMAFYIEHHSKGLSFILLMNHFSENANKPILGEILYLSTVFFTMRLLMISLNIT